MKGREKTVPTRAHTRKCTPAEVVDGDVLLHEADVLILLSLARRTKPLNEEGGREG